MNVRIGYFAPEFPEQTSTFFWREGQALAELGIEFDWVSTRRPPKAIMSHSWSQEAQKNTTYLVPFGFKDFLSVSILMKLSVTAPTFRGRRANPVGSTVVGV